jgi:hypothetical protein
LWVLRVCQLEVFASESSLVDRYTESESEYDHKPRHLIVEAI